MEVSVCDDCGSACDGCDSVCCGCGSVTTDSSGSTEAVMSTEDRTADVDGDDTVELVVD